MMVGVVVVRVKNPPPLANATIATHAVQPFVLVVLGPAGPETPLAEARTVVEALEGAVAAGVEVIYLDAHGILCVCVWDFLPSLLPLLLSFPFLFCFGGGEARGGGAGGLENGIPSSTRLVALRGFRFSRISSSPRPKGVCLCSST